MNLILTSGKLIRMWFINELYLGLSACNFAAITFGFSVLLATIAEDPPLNCDLTFWSFSMASKTGTFPFVNQSKWCKALTSMIAGVKGCKENQACIGAYVFPSVIIWRTTFSGCSELWTSDDATTEAARTLSEARTKWKKELSTRAGTSSGKGSWSLALALVECSFASFSSRQCSCFGMLLEATWRYRYSCIFAVLVLSSRNVIFQKEKPLILVSHLILHWIWSRF